MTLTLSVDCGGGGIKAAALDDAARLVGEPVRVPTPYPFPTQLFTQVLADVAAGFPRADRATVGLPGMVRHGVVVSTPHYVTSNGPSTDVAPHLLAQWSGFDAHAAVTELLGVPAIVLNDAEVHAAGVVTGSGVEVVLTLGTGLGCGWTDAGQLSPHLELSQAQVGFGVTVDDYVGELARQAVGDARWADRVAQVVAMLAPVLAWDRLFLGGGNASRLPLEEIHGWGPGVTVVANDVALTGGVRAWELGFDRWGGRDPESRHAV